MSAIPSIRFVAFLTCLVTMSQALAPPVAAQTPLTPADEAAAMRAMAAGLPIGSRIKVELRSGSRLTGWLMTRDGETLVIKRDAAKAGPALAIRVDEIRRLERDDRRGLDVARAIGAGAAGGAAAMLAFLAVTFAVLH